MQAWLERRAENLELALEDECEDFAALSADEFGALALRHAGVSLRDDDEFVGYHLEEDDEVLGDAARALDLPRWAKVTHGSAGGVGSSYEQPYLALAPGKTLEDFARWLGERG